MSFYKEWIAKNVFNTRLDRIISKTNPHLTQGLIHKLLRKKDIIVNMKKARANMVLNTGDIISYKNFLKLDFEYKASNVNSSPIISQKIKDFANLEFVSKIIYNSEELLAINKSSNVAVQGGTKIEVSLQDALDYLNYMYKYDLRMVHRIDKDTTGLLIFAKGYQNAIKITSAFKDKLIKKIYLALVWNRPVPSTGIIQDSEKYFDSYNNCKTRESLTYYKMIKHDTRKSLVLFAPISGIKHQIRKHALKIGCPIIGDSKYNAIDVCTNLKLHSLSIDFDHFIFEKEVFIFIPPPKNFLQNLFICNSQLYEVMKNFYNEKICVL